MANAVEVKNVTMEFNMSKEKVDSIKEYFIKLVKRELHFEQFLALKDVSVTIEQGDVFGIVGLNGSGKSTLLKVISGILKPTKGTVKTVGTISPMIELGAGFDMDLTARENIFLNGTMLGFSEEEINARLDEILSFADIGDFIHQPVKTYSSGMFVRLAFAVAINIDPEILVVDEALSVGDVFFQSKCYHKFEEFKKQGKTILFEVTTWEAFPNTAIVLFF